MKLNVLGVKRISGTSSKTGNDFDMCNLLGIVPVQTGGGKAVRIEGYGYEVAELPLDQSALALFAGIKFPSSLIWKPTHGLIWASWRPSLSALWLRSSTLRRPDYVWRIWYALERAAGSRRYYLCCTLSPAR